MAKKSPKDLLNTVSPAKMAAEVWRGYKRAEPDRWRSRFTSKLMGGPAFTSDTEVKCDSPLPLLFNVARTLVPQLVINFPKHVVETPYLAARQYAQSIGLALSLYDKKQAIPNIYRTVIVDALHSLGILKTGIESGGDVLSLANEADGSTKIDNGQIYTERVSFENFVFDPDCREYLFLDARFLGNIIRVPRQVLLDSGQYDEDLVMRLPRDSYSSDINNSAAVLTMGNINATENADFEDVVKIVEVWVPSANAVVTIPGYKDFDCEDYLRVADYYGVKEGPYTFLSLTIPIPDNPLPVPLMRVLFQLEMSANRMAVKISNQADRQKSILLYRAQESESAKKIVDAADGETIQMDDPTAVNTINLGGQVNSNEEHLDTLLTQLNMLAANVETLSGVSSAAKSATAANILQQNASVGLADMQNAVYGMAAQEARRRAFYIHTDPLLNVILAKRVQIPGQMTTNEQGRPQWATPPSVQEIQEFLTPEQRNGDFLDLAFTIEPESMARVDSKMRLQQETAFCTQLLPAVVGAAQISQQLGMAFDAAQMLSMMAKDSGITWMDSVLYSPQIQQKAAMEYNAIQQATGDGVKPGQEQPQQNPLQNAMLQNGQQGNVQAPQPNQQQQNNAGAQGGANDAQRIIRAALMQRAQPKSALPNQTAGF
jgi:hypothetical protein